MLGRLKVAHISSGPGMANAAYAATLLMERYSPSALVLFGIGGAFHDSGLCVGDVAAADSESFADMGVVTSKGFMGAREMGLSTLTRGSRKSYDTFRLDRKLLSISKTHVDAAGPFLTVSTVTGSLKEAEKLLKRYDSAICENMEGAGAAIVCARYAVPMLEIRGISNMVEDRNVERWEKGTAAENCASALVEILRLLQ